MNDQRRLILTAASSLFLKNGISNVKVIDIANELRISKKTIYKYFESKEHLVKCTYFLYEDLHRDRARAILFDPELDFLEKITGMILNSKDHLRDLSEGLLKDISDNHPYIQRCVKVYVRNSVKGRFIHLLKEGSQKGYIKEDFDLDGLPSIYFMSINNFLSRIAWEENKSDLREVLNMLIENLIIFFNGILNTHASEKFLAMAKQKGLITQRFHRAKEY